MTFQEWCDKKYEQDDDDFGMNESFMLRLIHDGDFTGNNYREIVESIWASDSLYKYKQLYQEWLGKLYLKYIFEEGL